MSQIKKMVEISKKSVDIKTDIALINQHSLKELQPEDVFAFAVSLCDNEIDRDFERFTEKSLGELAPLFVGKTGIFDHSWSAKNQVARLYKVGVEDGGGKNSLGEPLKILKGYAYILRGEETAEIISKIEGGILKEVSIGFAVASCACSICGAQIGWFGCADGHKKGREYDGKLCFGILEKPTDAFEFSFVAVPAQRGAGITKNHTAGDVEKAFEILLAADIVPFEEQLEAVNEHYKKQAMGEGERARREEILNENEKFLEKGEQKQ